MAVTIKLKLITHARVEMYKRATTKISSLVPTRVTRIRKKLVSLSHKINFDRLLFYDYTSLLVHCTTLSPAAGLGHSFFCSMEFFFSISSGMLSMYSCGKCSAEVMKCWNCFFTSLPSLSPELCFIYLMLFLHYVIRVVDDCY